MVMPSFFRSPGRFVAGCPGVFDVVVAPGTQRRARREEVEPLGFDGDRVAGEVLEGQRPVTQAAHAGVDVVLLAFFPIDEVLISTAGRLNERGCRLLHRKIRRRQFFGDPRVVSGLHVAGEPLLTQHVGLRNVIGDVGQTDLGTRGMFSSDDAEAWM